MADKRLLMMMGAISGIEYDTDAVAYLTAIGVPNNATIYYTGTPQEITGSEIWTAVNTFFLDYKSAGLWTKRSVIYPFIGGTETAHKYNAKDPRDLNVAYRLQFNGGITHSGTGALPNGSTGWADTFWVKPSNLISFSFYSRTNNNISGYDVSTIKNDSAGYNILQLRSSSTDFLISNNVSNSQLKVTSFTDSFGYYMANFNGSVVQGFKNGTSRSGVYSFFTNAQPILPFVLFRYRDEFGGSTQFSNRECAFSVFGENLTPTEALAEYNIIQALQIALNREV